MGGELVGPGEAVLVVLLNAVIAKMNTPESQKIHACVHVLNVTKVHRKRAIYSCRVWIDISNMR